MSLHARDALASRNWCDGTKAWRSALAFRSNLCDVVGPLLLLLGLTGTDAATTSLLLTLESVETLFLFLPH